MRAHPQLMLRLQNGRFDAPDRLFWSVNDTWRSVTSLPTDVKELIPEFYSTDPSFLLNTEQIDFGCRASGEAWLKLLSSGLLLSSARNRTTSCHVSNGMSALQATVPAGVRCASSALRATST